MASSPDTAAACPSKKNCLPSNAASCGSSDLLHHPDKCAFASQTQPEGRVRVKYGLFYLIRRGNPGLMRYVLVSLTLLGFIASGLALREHYRTDSSPCSINERWDCGIVNHSPFAVLAGVPVAVIGM